MINFAVIGQGYIGKRHAEVIQKNRDARLVAVCDVKSPESCGVEKFKEPFYNSIKGVLENHPEIDVVNICTPNATHYELSNIALEHEKHVVIEKPMTINSKHAKELLELAEEKDKKIFCVMQNRYSPPSVWVKDVVERGLLGKIYMVQVNCFWNRDERYYTKDSWHGSQEQDGGTLFTQFSHFVDMVYWLFGDIIETEGVFKDFNHQKLTDFEDSGIVNFEFINGGLCNFNYSTSVYQKNLESSMRIIAEKGSVVISGQYMNEVEVCNIQDYQMPELSQTNPPNHYGAYTGSSQNHAFVIENVINHLKNDEKITTNAWDGFKVVEIIEKIYQKRQMGFSKE